MMKLYHDCRLGGQIEAVLRPEDSPLMLVHENVKECSVFLYAEDKYGTRFPGGTAFFLQSRPNIPGEDPAVYLVTAKHSLDDLKKLIGKGKAENHLWIRGNKSDGTAKEIKVSMKDWRFHPSDSKADVAAMEWDRDGRGKGLSFRSWAYWNSATAEKIRTFGLGVGDPVFVPGLFCEHPGTRVIEPIVRCGTVAMMPSEKVDEADAFLIELRSISGLSGSPVFVQAAGVRRLRVEGMPEVGAFPEGHPTFLLGLIRGHMDKSGTKEHTGISAVVPVTKILEVLDREDFVKERRERTKLKEKSKPRVTLDSAMAKKKIADPNAAAKSAIDEIARRTERRR